jgi:hypothetical protein
MKYKGTTSGEKKKEAPYHILLTILSGQEHELF